MKDSKGHGSDAKGGLSTAARERVNIGKATDARHFPQRSSADMDAMADRAKPQGSFSATPGRFDAAQTLAAASAAGLAPHQSAVHAATAGAALPPGPTSARGAINSLNDIVPGRKR
jgi:hypothetical protein